MALALLSLTMFVLLTTATMRALRQEARHGASHRNEPEWLAGRTGADR